MILLRNDRLELMCKESPFCLLEEPERRQHCLLKNIIYNVFRYDIFRQKNAKSGNGFAKEVRLIFTRLAETSNHEITVIYENMLATLIKTDPYLDDVFLADFVLCNKPSFTAIERLRSRRCTSEMNSHMPASSMRAFCHFGSQSSPIEPLVRPLSVPSNKQHSEVFTRS